MSVSLVTKPENKIESVEDKENGSLPELAQDKRVMFEVPETSVSGLPSHIDRVTLLLKDDFIATTRSRLREFLQNKTKGVSPRSFNWSSSVFETVSLLFNLAIEKIEIFGITIPGSAIKATVIVWVCVRLWKAYEGHREFKKIKKLVPSSMHDWTDEVCEDLLTKEFVKENRRKKRH